MLSLLRWGARAPTATTTTARRALSTSESLRVPPTQVTRLDNGLRVASEEGIGETATVGVWVNTGSSYETEQNNGVAHFLEHLAFKGTANRTQKQLELEIENMGAQLNAYTSREQTVYYCKALKKDVPRAVEILADIVQHSELTDAAIERERSVILREAQEVESMTDEVMYDHLHAIAFQGTSHGFNILGPEQNIRSIKRADLVQYIQTHYNAPRMLVVGAGAVEHTQLAELSAKHFASLPAAGPTRVEPPTVRYTGSQVVIPNANMPLAHLILACKSVGFAHPDYYTMTVIQAILGTWDIASGGGAYLGSRLAELAATEGLAHSVNAFNIPFNDVGLFGVYATGDAHQVEDLPYEVLNEMVRMSQAVTPAEVERAKQRVKASVLKTLNGSTNIAEDIGRQMLNIGRRLPPAEIIARIDQITPQEVMRVASEHMYDFEPSVVAMGPVEHLPDYNHIRSWTSWRTL